MFYEITDELREISPECIDPEKLTVGCITSEELLTLGPAFGFDSETVAASQKASPYFRTGVDVQAKYTFAELRNVNRDGHEDSVSFYIKKNFLLIVDINDEDDSTVNSFFCAVRKYPPERINEERVIFCCLDALLSDGNMIAEKLRNRLTNMEEFIIRGTAKEDFSIELLKTKKKILRYFNYYGQILDITEALEENENDVLNENNLIYISNLSNKVRRLYDEMNQLDNAANHLQDAYASLMDQRMNNTMKILTILTTVFFPLTIIVGWYGMNFRYMPELNWKYGYLYVILLSVVEVLVLIIIGKKKKWF